MPRIIIKLHTGFAGCTHKDEEDFPDDEWDAMTPEQQEEVLDELARVALDRSTEGGLDGALYRGMLKRDRQRYAAAIEDLLFGTRKGKKR